MKFLKYFFFEADVAEIKPEIPKKRETDEESSDSKKIKTEEKISEVSESEPVISLAEMSSKKNVCKLKLHVNYRLFSIFMTYILFILNINVSITLSILVWQ